MEPHRGAGGLTGGAGGGPVADDPLERGDLQVRVSLLSDDEDVRVVTRLVNRSVLAVLGSVVGVLSVMLLHDGLN